MSPRLRHCPICKHKGAHRLYENTLASLDGLDMSYRVARCKGCGFAFADQLPTATDYDTYYYGLSKYDVGTVTVATDAPTPPRALQLADRIRCDAAIALIRVHGPAQAAIVDLGCGSGMLLGALRDDGWRRLTGFDPAPRARAQANALYDLDCVYRGTLREATADHDWTATDVVCLMGVLEHLPELESDLAHLVAALSTNTRILIEVPALERFSRKPFEPYGEFSLEHIQYFSASSLTNLLLNLGYVPEAVNLVDLPNGYCDSLMGIFVRSSSAIDQAPKLVADDSLAWLTQYIVDSEKRTNATIQRIDTCGADSLIIYGAGSHTARLIPKLSAATLDRIICVVDSNPNLEGKCLGSYAIERPSVLSIHASATVVISSFRSQSAIVATLSESYSNPILTLY